MTTTTTKIDPLLTAALDHMAEAGPTWSVEDRDRWCGVFMGIVTMLYPGRPARKPRKSRAKELAS